MNPAIALLLTLTVGVGLYAQKTAPAPARPTSGLPTTSTNTNTTNNNIPFGSNPSTSTANTISRPIYLSGKVVLQDGTAPPDLVKIERICGGSPRAQGYTDSKGRFQFQVDSQMGVEPDASDPMNRQSSMSGSRPANARTDLTGCDLRAVLPGFISGTVSLASHSSFDNPDVGIIVLKRAGNVDGTTISMSSLNAPKDALKAYDKGREWMRKEKPEEALRSFQKAVDIYPGYATAWYQLALLQRQEAPRQAEESLKKSIQADPKFVSPYLTLILIYERDRRWAPALELAQSVVRLNAADFPQAHFFKAAAEYNLYDNAAAEKSVRKAIDLDVRHEYPQSERLLATILLQKSDLAGASEHFHKYLEESPNATDASQVRAQIAQIEKQTVAGKEP